MRLDLAGYRPTLEVLIVDDNRRDLDHLSALIGTITGNSFVHQLEEPTRVPDLLRDCSPHVVMVSQNLGAMNGIDLIAQHRRNYPHTAFVLLKDTDLPNASPKRLADTATAVIAKRGISSTTLYPLLLRACRDRFKAGTSEHGARLEAKAG